MPIRKAKPVPHSRYYEGQLQIRNANKELLNSIEEDINKNQIYIQKKFKQKNGADYNLSSQKYIQQIAKKLGQQYGAIVKISRKLFSRNRQTGKAIYRLNACVIFPEYQKDDIIETKNTVMQVQKLIKKDITGIDLKTGKKVTIKNERGLRKLEKKQTQVIRTVPSLEVLDPETYQPTLIQNPSNAYIGQKIKVVKSKKGLFLV